MADGPVFVMRTICDNSVSTGFECNSWISRGWLYILLAQPWVSVLGTLKSFLNILEQTTSSLPLTLLRGCILGSVRAS